MTRVGVIGGTGFIGSQLVEHLLLHGHDVTCFLREASDPSYLATLACSLETVPARDWHAPTSLTARFAGLDRLYNCSSAGTPHYSIERLREHEVERTRRIALAAAQAKIGRFIQLSTVWYHGSKLPEPLREELEPKPRHNPVRVFVEREQAVRDVQKETGLSYTMIRPASVIAPRDAGSFVARLSQAYRAGRMPLFAGGTHIVSLADGRDTVDAILRLSLDAKAVNETYLQTSYEVTYDELRAAFAAVLGGVPQRKTPPAGIVKLAASLSEATTPYGRPVALSRFAITALSQNVRIDDAKIRALSILPRHDFAASRAWALAPMAARIGKKAP